MKWIASLTLFLALAGGALAAGTDDQYLDILGQILQADSLLEGGHSDTAALKYRDAQTALEKLKADHPKWNETVVGFRLDYLAGKLKQLDKYLPATTTAPASVVPLTPQQQLAALQEQLGALNAANEQLQQKLKEALSVQPAAVAPGELAKAQERIVALQKERDLLVVALDQQKAASASAPAKAASEKLAEQLAALKAQSSKDDKAAQAKIADLQRQVDDSRKKLADATAQINTLKARPSGDEANKLASDRDKLKKDLAAQKTQSDEAAKAAKSQIADLQRQMDESRKKLADATAQINTLKSRPSGDNARELASERDQLKKDLAAQKVQSSDHARAAKSQIADLQRQVEETKKALANTTAELNAAKSRPSSDNIKELTSERDKLKKELAAVSKELADREAHPEKAPAAPSQDAAKLKQVEKERDALAQEVAALSKPAATSVPGNAAGLSAENAGLRARLAVLEAPAVPYTPEELAVLNAAPTTNTPGTLPMAKMEITHKAHSVRELPPGAGELMTEALRTAEVEHDYPAAEKKFLEVLAQDPENVYVLVHLGLAQFAEGHLEDCEKNVQHALKLDPDDPGALYLMGILRFRQEKLDDALDALSRSATLDATNSSTQNYLGCVLAAKGLREKAETAFRKALSIDSLYADAHYNLAFVYATEKPPSMALAKWHYQRALALHHAKSSELEKLLAGGP